MSPEASAQTLEERCIDTIRFLAVDGVQKAKSGHPGMPMGAAAVAHTLFTRHLRFDPADPAWPDRDRFVLSAGHASMLLYSLLHLTGYDLSLDDLRAFRQWGSRTPGHPEYGHTAGVETTTGPLGQGFANAVGMAVAERFLGATFNGDGPERDGPLHLRPRRRRRHDGGHQQRGRLVRRPPEARQAHRPLRRQPHHHRRLHRPRLHRGRLRALRRLRMARAEDRRRQRRRGHRRGHRRGQGRDRPAVADRRAHAHRLRLAEQAGHGGGARRAARRRRGQADQGGLRLAARAGLLRGRRREGVLRGGREARRGRARGVARAPRRLERGRLRPRRVLGRRLEPRAPQRLGRRPAGLQA